MPAQKKWRGWKASRHMEKAREMARRNDYAGALLEFDRALALSPGNPLDIEARYQIASLCVALGQFTRALQEYERIEKDYPGAGRAEDAILMRAMIYEQWYGRPDLAEKTYQEYLQKYPGGRFRQTAERRLLLLLRRRR